MQIFEDIKVEGKYIIVLTFDEQNKVRLESQRTGRLITSIVWDVLTYGVEKYKYTKKEHAVGY